MRPEIMQLQNSMHVPEDGKPREEYPYFSSVWGLYFLAAARAKNEIDRTEIT